MVKWCAQLEYFKTSSNCYVATLLCISITVTIVWYNYLGSYVSYLFTQIKILTKSSDKSRCWCSFRRLNPYHSHLKILHIDDLFKFEVAKFVYVFLNNKTPNSFCKYFCKTNDRSSGGTRQSTDCNNLNIPCYRTNKLQTCIK